MFRKLLFGFALALWATVTVAQSIDTTGLTDAQIADIKAKAAAAAAENARTGVKATQKEVSTAMTLAATWGQQAATAAEGFAKALGIAARELNVTINDFLASDAGKLTAAIIIWKVAGHSIISLFFGLIFLIVGMLIVRTVYLRLFTKEMKEVQYNHLWGMFSGTKVIRVPKSIKDLEKDGEWLAFWIVITITFLTLTITGTIIT